MKSDLLYIMRICITRRRSVLLCCSVGCELQTVGGDGDEAAAIEVANGLLEDFLADAKDGVDFLCGALVAQR